MTVTVYNLVSAVIWCNLFIFAFCFFIERNSLISSCGIKVLSLLFALAVLRVLIPVEFSFTRVLRSENLFPFIRDMLGGSCFVLPVSRGKLLAIIWALGSAILLAKLIIGLIRQSHAVKHLPVTRNLAAESAFASLNKGKKARLIVSESVSMPCAVGFFAPTVLVPDLPLTESEFCYVISHELCHFNGHDSWNKLLAELVKIALWWNPPVYAMQSCIEHMLEVRCDKRATAGLSELECVEYAEAVKNVLHICSGKKEYFSCASALTGHIGGEKDLLTRMDCILNKPKEKKGAAVLITSLALTAFVFSYLFVIQPESYPPEADLIGMEELTKENAYILQDGENYWLCFNGTKNLVTDSFLEQQLNSELEIKEAENEQQG